MGGGLSAFAQQSADTTTPSQLKEVFIKSWMRRDITALPEEQNGFLYSGKKSESVSMAGTNANVAVKTARQVFAKIPGVFVYDMDGSGNQINISTRGLDAHRSWEMNNRQNGTIINSDMYGYPASHYSAPAESFERIDVVRGAGALQYGAQFGGAVNYITKSADSAKAFGLEAINTMGSFGLMSSYTAVGGTHKKFSYYAYYHRRHSDGYRTNGESDATAQFVQMTYRANEKLSVKAEFGRSKYQYHIPGPLTDSMFKADPRQSTRSRNYFSPDIYVPSVTVDWKISPQTKLAVTALGVFGKRSSVQLDAFATVPDTLNRLTGLYRNRQVDIDGFNSRTLEGRLLHQYTVFGVHSKLAVGFAYFNNDLHRRQLGKGTTGTDYNLTVEGAFGRDLHFKTGNVALFAENVFQLSNRWSVSPGLRAEAGRSKMSGTINYYNVNPLPATFNHRFVLGGVSTQYSLNKDNTLYGGISQAYRPVIFKDIIPASTYEQIDKNLKDATGYNAEAGVRGKLARHLQYDVSVFSLLYKDRLGALVLQDGSGQAYVFRTNVGDSRTNGAEVFLQYKFPLTSTLYAGLFTSTSYMRARYINGRVATGNENKTIKGNKVESAPDWITRNGLEVLYRGLSTTILYSYTSSSFSDPLNTVTPTANGAKGPVPGYGLLDVNATVRINNIFTVRTGLSNIFNKQYFTKRPLFYPGPGVWPGDGRNGYVTLGVKI